MDGGEVGGYNGTGSTGTHNTTKFLYMYYSGSTAALQRRRTQIEGQREDDTRALVSSA